MSANATEPLSRRAAMITGVGRSGTSFLGKLLDASREVLYRHEPDISISTRSIPFTPSADDIGNFDREARAYFAQLTHRSDERVSGSRPVFHKAFRTGLGNAAMPGWVYGAKALGKLGIIFHVPDMIARAEPPFVAVKSVSSTMRMPIFAHAMPDLKIIHIVRHPCGVLASVIRGRAAGKVMGNVHLEELFEIPEASDYGFTFDDLVNASYARQQAFRWMVRNDFVQRHLHGNPNYLFVSYEKLCCELESEMQRICAFLGLELDSQMKDYMRQMNSESTGDASYFSLMRNPMSALAKWEKELSPDDAAAIADVVKHSELGRQTVAEYDMQRARLDT